MSASEMEQPRGWNEKYWDIISDLYWTPRYLGLKSIPRTRWQVANGRASVALSEMANPAGPLYSRLLRSADLNRYLSTQEEVLNHFFTLALAIAGDEVLSRLLCRPLGIDDAGPFRSFGNDLKTQFGWGPNENITQPDGFFLSPNSAIGVELKLGSASWQEQIAKYAALMVWHELATQKRANLGLLFVVPANAISHHWSKVGLAGPAIPDDFLETLDKKRLPEKIQILFHDHKERAARIFQELRLHVVSWNDFADGVAEIRTGLDCSRPGDQTLDRLMAGLYAQISVHHGTGIPETITKQN